MEPKVRCPTVLGPVTVHGPKEVHTLHCNWACRPCTDDIGQQPSTALAQLDKGRKNQDLELYGVIALHIKPIAQSASPPQSHGSDFRQGSLRTPLIPLTIAGLARPSHCLVSKLLSQYSIASWVLEQAQSRRRAWRCLFACRPRLDLATFDNLSANDLQITTPST